MGIIHLTQQPLLALQLLLQLPQLLLQVCSIMGVPAHPCHLGLHSIAIIRLLHLPEQRSLCCHILAGLSRMKKQ